MAKPAAEKTTATPVASVPAETAAPAKPAAKRAAPAAKAAQPLDKAVRKPAAAKPAAAKPAAAKPAAAAKPVKKEALAKPAKKTAAAKPAAVKPAVKAAPKSAAKPAPKAAAQAEPKARKPRLVRDSFTMPEEEYAVLGQVKKACLKAGVEIKKSELLRIGVYLISKLDMNALQKVLATLPQLKTGRPKAS